MFVEYKIEINKVREMLSSFFTSDQYGKYSYLDFIKEFQATEKNNPMQRGRRLIQTVEEIKKRIAYHIDQRGIKNLGTLLAD